MRRLQGINIRKKAQDHGGGGGGKIFRPAGAPT